MHDTGPEISFIMPCYNEQEVIPYTIPEFVERQSAVMKSMFDEFAAQATKLGELSNAAMKDVYAPITARAEAAADFAKTLRA